MYKLGNMLSTKDIRFIFGSKEERTLTPRPGNRGKAGNRGNARKTNNKPQAAMSRVSTKKAPSPRKKGKDLIIFLFEADSLCALHFGSEAQTAALNRALGLGTCCKITVLKGRPLLHPTKKPRRAHSIISLLYSL